MIAFRRFLHILLARIISTSSCSAASFHGAGKCTLIYLVVGLLTTGIGPLLHAANPSEEIHRYQEVTGQSVKTVQWRLENGDGATLRCTSPREHHTTTVGPDYDTSHWQVEADDGRTDFIASRHGNTIQINGRFKGQAINKTLRIDGAPWYQATSLSLRQLATSDETHQVFWTIRYHTLKAHKVKAIKKGVESITATGGPKDLLHIQLSLTGLLAPFWKSDYWFSLPELVFYRFKGPSGPPGSPMTVITRMDG
jgi:hypothetical protein